MMTRTLVLVLTLTAGTAAADKPTAAQAAKAVEAWSAAIGDGPKQDAAVALTAASFYSISREEDGPKCKESTATTAAAIAKAITCMKGEVEEMHASALKPWTKAIAKLMDADDGGPLTKLHRKKLAALETTSTLVVDFQPCAGQGSAKIFAVTTEKVKDKQVPKVSAALTANFYCGE